MPAAPTSRRRRTGRTGRSCVAAATVSLLAAAALVGCSSDDDPPPASEPTTGPTRGGATVPAGVAHDPETAPKRFTSRRALPACGVEHLRPPTASLSLTGSECVTEAVGTADGAELVVQSHTVEGDPVVTYFRALPGGGVETFTDSTRDRWGPQEWFLTRCDDLELQERRGTRWVEATGDCTKPRKL